MLALPWFDKRSAKLRLLKGTLYKVTVWLTEETSWPFMNKLTWFYCSLTSYKFHEFKIRVDPSRVTDCGDDD